MFTLLPTKGAKHSMLLRAKPEFKFWSVKLLWINCNSNDASEAHSILQQDNYMQNCPVYIQQWA